MNIIGTRIMEGRKAKGLSQERFAKKLFISPQAVGKWERGESLPDIFTLAKIAEIIGKKDICYFLGKPLCSCAVCECECCNKVRA